jgi:hypothetical protein
MEHMLFKFLLRDRCLATAPLLVYAFSAENVTINVALPASEEVGHTLSKVFAKSALTTHTALSNSETACLYEFGRRSSKRDLRRPSNQGVL